MKKGAVFAAVFIVGVVGAAALKVQLRDAPLCNYARGQVPMLAGDDVAGAADHKQAVETYIDAELGTPDISSNPIVEILDDDARGVTVLSENGTVVATFGIEQTDGGGFMVSSVEFCTDGDLGPFLAQSFDPTNAYGSKSPSVTTEDERNETEPEQGARN
jgi:hypothetical protein